MADLTIYYRDGSGRIFSDPVVFMGNTLIAYPSHAFTLDNDVLQPRAGIHVLRADEGAMLLAAQQADDQHTVENVRAEIATAEKERIARVRKAFRDHEFGDMSEQTVQDLFRISMEETGNS
jgi:hypothetical protein